MILLPSFVEIKNDKAHRLITLGIYEQSYHLEFDTDDQHDSTLGILVDLKSGKADISDVTPDLLEFLQSENLIVNKSNVPTEIKTGSEFYSEIFHKINSSLFLIKGKTKLAEALENPNGNLSLLYGFTLEYYHVTRRAIQCLSPILKHSLPSHIKQIATEFIKDELFHENIMARSFVDLEGEEFDVYKSQPLPSTDAYMDHLYDMARHRPMSFFASLFIYEGDDDDLEFYANAIDLDPALNNLRDAHLAHANINIKGGHADISKQFFGHVESISLSDQAKVIEDCEYLVELYYIMQNEIYEVYESHFKMRVAS